MSLPRDITGLLREIASGNKSAEADLIPLVYQELRTLARRYMRRENTDHTLQTTALVHEAYLRLTGEPVNWQNRSHFFAVAATVMRRVLVDHARAQRAGKRGGGTIRVESIDIEPPGLSPDVDKILALDAALDRLAELDAQQCRIVELRFFAGLTVDETAEVIGVSARTVKRDWQLARAWLLDQLTGP